LSGTSSADDFHDDGRLLSPYADDEPACEDALYDALRTRRKACSRPTKASAATTVSPLFAPGEEQDAEDRDAVDRLYDRVRRVLWA
jgi:hypothetical protein